MGIRFYSFYPGRANRLRFKKCLGIVWWMTWRIVVLASFIMLINKACIGVQCSKPIVTPTDSTNVATTLQDSVYGAIYALRIQHPDIVMAQCIEESGHFTSPSIRRRTQLYRNESTLYSPDTCCWGTVWARLFQQLVRMSCGLCTLADSICPQPVT